MFGYYQFRLYQHTNRPQLVAPYHLSVGLGYSLGFRGSARAAPQRIVGRAICCDLVDLERAGRERAAEAG